MKNKARTPTKAPPQTTRSTGSWQVAKGRHVTARSNAEMDTHSMIFVTIGNLVSPSSSVNGDPLFDFSDHLVTSFLHRVPSSPDKCGGGFGPPPSERKDLPASGRYCSSDLVEGRVGNLIGFNLWSSLNDSRQDLRHFGIRSAVVGFRVLFVFPQTDSERFLFPRGDERDLVLEPLLFSEQRNDFLIQPLGKLRNAIGLQVHGNFACIHGNLLDCRGQGPISDNPLSLDHLMTPSVS